MAESFEPMRTLNPVAREIWDRCTKDIYRDGRWHNVNRELLLIFCETYSLYRAFWADIEKDGTVVPGRDGGTVKHPSLSGLHSTRADLIRLARAVPLTVVGNSAAGGDDVERMLAEVMA